MVTPQPFYTTAAKEYGITGQQMGWNRILTPAEIESITGTISFRFTSSDVFRVPDNTTELLVDDIPTAVTPGTNLTVTVTGADVVIKLYDANPVWSYSYVPNTVRSWHSPEQAYTWDFKAAGAASNAPGCEVVARYQPPINTSYAVWVPGVGSNPSGGWPGGGRGCTANNQGKGGGGLATIQPDTNLVDWKVDLPNTIVCAGGGGGVNGWQGNSAGAGGYPDGWNATSFPTKGGGGGTQFAGGDGGNYNSGNPGSFGQGGNGVSHGAQAIQEGAGGGGGYYGGGASGHNSAAAGGGGGSSKIHANATLVSAESISGSSGYCEIRRAGT